MNRTANILMLGGAKRVSLALLLKEAGTRMGLDVGIVSSEIVRDVPIASVGKVVEGRKWNDPDIYDNLRQTVSNEKISIVLPFVDGAIEKCSKLKSMLPEVFIPVSDYEQAKAMYDKQEAAELFACHGFPIPATYSFHGCKYPTIAKPRRGSASKGIKIIGNDDDLHRIANPGEYLLQEYIDDRDEYTVDCYVSMISGQVKCTVPRLRISTSGGEVDRTVTRRIPRLEEESRSILEKLQLKGPVTIQFIHDRQRDRYLLMEINPRLGGGVVCSIRAGADIASMILQESLGQEAQECNDWRDNALMARYFSEVMFF